MEFRLLGPLEVSGTTAPFPLVGRRLPAVLATLLLHPNRTLTVGQLARGAWAEPPSAVGSNVRTYVARLRAAFVAAGEQDSRLVTEPAGYRLAVRRGELDVERFDELVDQGTEALERSDPEAALVLLARSLVLWRGEALSGLAAGPLLRAELARLDERRLIVTERWAEAASATGRHSEVAAEMSRLVRIHPLREPLWAHLMRALNRGGDPAAALDAYHEAYRVFAAELGIAPSQQLQRLHQQILTDDPALAAPARPGQVASRTPVPRQVPAGTAAFTGRTTELRWLDEQPDGVFAVVGTAGVGKTALALRWAHRAADRFPDGQLYMDLRGHAAGPPVDPADALGAFLRALGVTPDRIPDDPAEAAALYRSMLADRKLLVLLDNAGSADHVRPLLPGSPGSLAVVTSRDRLTGLVAQEGARVLRLDVLDRRDSVALIADVIGADRVAAEPDAADRIAGLCVDLPLALRIAAAHLAGSPVRAVADLAVELAGDRLSALRVDGDPRSAVCAAFDLSFARLTDLPRRLFRLFGLLDAPDLGTECAARLLDATAEAAAGALATLAAAHLVEPAGTDRHRMHDLLRLFAAQRLQTEETPAVYREAVDRVARWHLDRVREAAGLVFPMFAVGADTFRSVDDAVRWFLAERHAVFAVVHRAAELPECRVLAAEIVGAMGHLVMAVTPRDGWAAAVESGLSAARAVGRSALVAKLLMYRASTQWDRGDVRTSTASYVEAADAYRRTGDRPGELTARMNQAVAKHMEGRPEEATVDYHAGLRLARHLGDHRIEGYALANLAAAHRDLGRYAEAIACAREACDVFRGIGDWQGEVDAADDLGISHRAAGDLPAAVETQRAALALLAGRDRLRHGKLLLGYGETLLAAGEPAEAAAHLTQAVAVLDELGATEADAARRALATVDRGRPNSPRSTHGSGRR